MNMVVNHQQPVKLLLHRGMRPHASRKSALSMRSLLYIPQRSYARYVPTVYPRGSAFKPPPPPRLPTKAALSIEDGHGVGETPSTDNKFDQYLKDTATSIFSSQATSISTLYSQYCKRAGRVLDLVIPYEERPPKHRRADSVPEATAQQSHGKGDGLVMVVHILFKPNGEPDKVCACSGFVVDAQAPENSSKGIETIITCAHTLDEIYRHVKFTADEERSSLSLIIPSDGGPRLVTQVLASMPRSDVIAIEVASSTSSPGTKLRTLPLSPFPVYNGESVLTHLFGAPGPPKITSSESRLPQKTTEHPDKDTVETPVPWLHNKAWRRWGAGVMLGYRSYTGIEVEAGIHSSLPHIQTSILPTPGSSGGPLINSDTGSVVGMISGRRMDNRVEGERGWGTSAEGIFEMFSLPGFTPTSKR